MADVRNLKVNGKPVDSVVAATVAVENPTDARGRRAGRTRPVRIWFRRKVETGKGQLFQAASNGDGRNNLLDSLEFDVLNPQFGVAYHVKAERVFVADYLLDNPDEQVPDGEEPPFASESVTCYAGRVEITAAGKTDVFDLPDFTAGQ